MPHTSTFETDGRLELMTEFTRCTRLRRIISLPLTTARCSGVICVESWSLELTSTQTDSRNRTDSKSPFWIATCRKLRPFTSNCNNNAYSTKTVEVTDKGTGVVRCNAPTLRHSQTTQPAVLLVLCIFCQGLTAMVTDRGSISSSTHTSH